MEVDYSFFNNPDYCSKIRNEIACTTGALIRLPGEKTELSFLAMNKENQNQLVIYGSIEAAENARDQIRVIVYMYKNYSSS